MSHAVPFPSADEGLDLHARLLTATAAAASDLCQAYWGPLVAWLEARFPSADPHFRVQAVGHALLGLAQRPGSFDPQRGDLGAFLRLSAKRDLFNLLKQEQRHQRNRQPIEVVEDREEARNSLQGVSSDPLVREEEQALALGHVERVRAACTPAEARVLDLMLERERRTEPFAAALGLDAASGEDAEHAVKRAKDRLKKRLLREGIDDA